MHVPPKAGLSCFLLLLTLVSCDEGTDPGPAARTEVEVPSAPPGSSSTPATPESSGAGTANGGVGTATNGAMEVVPARYELGDIRPGSSHTGQFRIRNISDQPLTFVRAVISCKCTTTTDISGRMLAPGESMDFDATLEAPRTPGVKDAKVQLVVEGGLRPVEIVVSGDVTMAIKAVPPYIGGVKGDQNRGEVRLESLDGRAFKILSSGGLAPPSGDAGAEWTLGWDLDRGPDLSTHIWWVIFTDHPECPVLPLRIRNPKTGYQSDSNRFERFWSFDERIVNAGTIEAGAASEHDVVIAHYNPRKRGAVENPMWRNVKAVRSLSPEVTARMIAVTPISRDELRVRFSITPAADFSGPLHAFLEIETETGVGAFPLLAVVE